MRGVRTGLSAALCLVAWVGIDVPAFGQADLKGILEGKYAELKQAMDAHDGPAVAAMLAPGFISVDIGGKTETAAQMVAEVKALQSDLNRSTHTTLLSVSGTGERAVVEQRYEMRTLKGGPDGAAHRIDLVTLSNDTWVKRDGAWVLARTATNSMTLRRDGRMVLNKKSSS